MVTMDRINTVTINSFSLRVTRLLFCRCKILPSLFTLGIMLFFSCSFIWRSEVALLTILGVCDSFSNRAAHLVFNWKDVEVTHCLPRSLSYPVWTNLQVFPATNTTSIIPYCIVYLIFIGCCVSV